MKKRILLLATFFLVAMVFLILITWAAVVFRNNPIESALAGLPWPAACTSKGCITTKSWLKQHNLETEFAAKLEKDFPTEIDTLTTLMRRHIASHSFLKSPVTRIDAKRYREEILNLTQEDQLKELIDLSLEDYDQKVIMPWLEQEALRQEYEVETTSELFSLLSRDKNIVVFPLNLKWSVKKGKIVER